MLKQLLAALTGAVVTAAAFFAAAAFQPADSTSIRVDDPVPPGDARDVRVAAEPGCEDLERRQRELERENVDLREQLAAAQFSAAVARGQLVAVEGEPQAWPDNVPPIFRPDAFGAELAQRAADSPALEVEEVDCSEYPCVGVLRAPRNSLEGSDEHPTSQDLVREMAVEGYAGGFSTVMSSVATSVARGGERQDDPTGFVAFAVVPLGDDELSHRVRQRIDRITRDLGSAQAGATKPNHSP